MNRCEQCGESKNDVEIRKSDLMLCDGCYQEQLITAIRSLADDNDHQQEAEETRTLEEESAMTVLVHDDVDDDEPGYDGDSEELEEELDVQQQTEQSQSVIIKKNSNTEEKCKKCSKKLNNGVRCLTCKKGFHWRCGGVTEARKKENITEGNSWECWFCRNLDKDCQLCKQQKKEIKNLKQNIVELEKHLQTINQELANSTLRCVELEDRVKIEQQLRKRFESELEELRKESSSDSDSSKNNTVSSDDTEYRESHREEGK